MPQRFIFPISSQPLGQTSHDLHVKIDPLLRLDFNKDYVIALRSASIPYTFYNISADIGNNTLMYNNAQTDIHVTIPDGAWEISDIESYLHYVMNGNGNFSTNTDTLQEEYDIELQINYARLRSVFTCTNNYSVSLTSNLSYKLGWGPYGGTPIVITGNQANEDTLSTYIPKIERTDRMFIRCNLAGGSLNGQAEDVLYSCPLTSGETGTSLTFQEGSVPVYVPLKTKIVDHIDLRLTDAFGNLLDINGESTEYVIEILENV